MKENSSREAAIVYFESAGAQNTEETLRLAKARAAELGIKKIVVATTKGDTAVKATKEFKGYTVITVTHTSGFLVPGTQELTEENRQKIENLGGRIFTGTHAFGGLARAARTTYSTHILGDFMANTLRMFGQGMKVAIEITLMAADAGLVTPEEEVIAISGTGRGADTAIVVKPAYTHDAFALRVKEIICKPRL
ncbi:MAG TPA: pyruvate kinase alpha/beta domain-containing protein [Dehalococcoidia bacterium]